ncbi:hypothetical protein QQG55_3110 [Brugia pahangi]
MIFFSEQSSINTRGSLKYSISLGFETQITKTQHKYQASTKRVKDNRVQCTIMYTLGITKSMWKNIQHGMKGYNIITCTIEFGAGVRRS